MRMSCNGCRVLRKGCSEDCSLKPCLQFIKSPQSQANATLFLAKFYGRAGLINLINAGPNHLRPSIFSSLLYEACGRIINPVYGSVGLMSTGNWLQCQTAVDAVLKGSSLTPQPLQGSDIRHNTKNSASPLLHRVRTRNRFKRSVPAKSHVDSVVSELINESDGKFTITGWEYSCDEDNKDFFEELNRAPSQDSFSVETAEPALVNWDEKPAREVEPVLELGLELTLGCNPVPPICRSRVIEISDSES